MPKLNIEQALAEIKYKNGEISEPNPTLIDYSTNSYVTPKILNATTLAEQTRGDLSVDGKPSFLERLGQKTINSIPGVAAVKATTDLITGNRNDDSQVGLVRGGIKSGVDLLFGLGKLGTKVQKFIAGEGFKPDDIYIKGTPANLKAEEFVKANGTDEQIGKFIGDVAQYIIPGAQANKITQGANFATKLGTRAVTSGGVATAQSGEVGTDTAIAAGAEVALPVVGKYIAKPAYGITKRLLRGFGSAFSGAGTNIIEQISNNPKLAKEITKTLKSEGSANLAESNAKEFIDGIKTVQKNASAEYGKALDSLGKVKISKKEFSDLMKQFTNEYGISKQGDELVLDGVEFFQPRNINKAKKIIDVIDSTKKFTGENLRSLIKQVEGAKYKTSSTEEARAFNSFIDDLSFKIRDTIAKNSPILEEANKNYRNSKNLIEGANKVISNTKFGGAKDIISVGNALDDLFNKNPLSGKYLDDFLKKADINPEEFKTKEAVRNITDKVQSDNTVGGNLFELVRSVTGSVLTPAMIRDITIKSGLAEEALVPVIEKMTPVAQKAFIEALTQD